MARAPSSSTSSMTATEADVEAQVPDNRLSHFSLVFRPSSVTDAMIKHKYSGEGTPEQPYIVEWLPNDPRNGMTFPAWRKWSITLMQAFATLAVTFVSTAYSGGVGEILADFGVSTEVVILGISLFVLGFAVGPLFWAPLSELYGRQVLFFFTYMSFTAFNAGAAGANSMATLVVLRFFAGAFGSSPLTNAGGVIADMFQADQRGLATAVFAAAPFLGPSIGPIIGGFLGETEGWRWVEGLSAIFSGVLWIAVTFFCPETYAPVLLRKRADTLSKLTGKTYVSKFDAHHPRKSIGTEFKVSLSRPWILLFREPIVFLTAIYMAIVYGTLYMLFAAFPIVFQEGRGWSPGIGGLAFLGVLVGMILAVVYSMVDNKRYARLVKAANGAAQPEARLPPAIFGSILLPIGLFWFAWTDGPEIHWVVSIIAGGFFAMGLVLVFLSLFNYLIDSYVIFAASAIAANSVMRSLFGAAFPLFTTQMYHNLGIHWATSIPAFLALACVPFPMLFYKYGEAIRKRCKFAAEAAAVLERMRQTHQEEDETDAEEEIAEEERRSLEQKRTRSRAGMKTEKEGHGQASGGVTSDDEATLSGAARENQERKKAEKETEKETEKEMK